MEWADGSGVRMPEWRSMVEQKTKKAIAIQNEIFYQISRWTTATIVSIGVGC
jgi:hypothetical protein